MFFAWTKPGSNGRRHNPMVRQWHSRTRCNIKKDKLLRPLSQRVEALSPDQVVRQPDWGFQDRPLTRKSSDWESTNINSKAGRPDPCLPGNPIHVLLNKQHSAENRASSVALKSNLISHI